MNDYITANQRLKIKTIPKKENSRFDKFMEFAIVLEMIMMLGLLYLTISVIVR